MYAYIRTYDILYFFASHHALLNFTFLCFIMLCLNFRVAIFRFVLFCILPYSFLLCFESPRFALPFPFDPICFVPLFGAIRCSRFFSSAFSTLLPSPLCFASSASSVPLPSPLHSRLFATLCSAFIPPYFILSCSTSRHRYTSFYFAPALRCYTSFNFVCVSLTLLYLALHHSTPVLLRFTLLRSASLNPFLFSPALFRFGTSPPFLRGMLRFSAPPCSTLLRCASCHSTSPCPSALLCLA